MDQPFSSEEIVEMSRGRLCPAGRAHAWYKEFENAKVGNCSICGWSDGDGIKTCFYSSEIGAVTHQNSETGAERSMTPEQVSLFRLRSAMCYIDENARALHFAEVRYHAAFEKSRVSKAYPGQIFRKKSDGTEWSDEDFYAQYEEREKNKFQSLKRDRGGSCGSRIWLSFSHFTIDSKQKAGGFGKEKPVYNAKSHHFQYSSPTAPDPARGNRRPGGDNFTR